MASDSISSEDILNASTNGVIATDEAGRIVFANRQVKHILGTEPEEAVGRMITDILPLSGPLVLESLKSGKPPLHRHLADDGVSMVLSISLIGNPESPRGAVCVFQSLDQFENTAQELESYKKLNRQLQAIFESSSDGIWVCDGSGRVVSINQASERLNGVRASDIIGKTVSEVMACGLFDRSATLEALETHRQVSVVQQIRKTGRTLLVTGTPVFDETGRSIMVVVNERDLTQLNAIHEQLEQSRMETEKYRDELAELTALQGDQHKFIAESEAMRQVLRVALKLARLQASNILILGESGTGKGLLAQFIHRNSHRSGKPFIQINCAALPESLLEAELFGYERGAFTGAREQGKAGLFELADGGTLFLDEIGDLPLTIQAKLLKYLDDYEVLRIGGLKPRKIDCMVIAATNRDLATMTDTHRFRLDLYYRLNTFTLRIPPLRERGEDLYELITHFLRSYNRAYHQKRKISREAFMALQAYSFPGNVRELKGLLKRAVLMSERDVLDELIIASLGDGSTKGKSKEASPRVGSRAALPESLLSTERSLLEEGLRQCRSTRELARYLGVSQPTVVRKLRRHGLTSRLSRS